MENSGIERDEWSALRKALRPIGVGDGRATQRDEVGVSLLENAGGARRIVQAAVGDDRHGMHDALRDLAEARRYGRHAL